jgi:death-on-curing protein
MIRFLSTELVVDLHDELLTRWGGEEGVGHRGGDWGVEAAVQAVKNSYYETVNELAAAYAVYIVQGHVFMDGNKRTGGAAAVLFMEANGIRPQIAPQELTAAMLELQQRAEAGQRTDLLIEWLADQL